MIKIKPSTTGIFTWTMLMLFFCLPMQRAQAQAKTADNAEAKVIIGVMENSANEWNKGNLDTFMNLYDPSATMMMPAGPVGLSAIRELYEKKYFDGKMPKQNLRYSAMQVRFLGDEYALLTGAFTLYGNNLPERSGRYSLVFKHTKN